MGFLSHPVSVPFMNYMFVPYINALPYGQKLRSEICEWVWEGSRRNGSGGRFLLLKDQIKLIKIMLCVADNFSREVADYIIYIIDVSAGDKIPHKGGPGITQADLLVINKTDLAAAVGADLSVMEQDALRMRDGGPFVFAQVKHGLGVEEIVTHVLHSWEQATGNKRY